MLALKPYCFPAKQNIQDWTHFWLSRMNPFTWVVTPDLFSEIRITPARLKTLEVLFLCFALLSCKCIFVSSFLLFKHRENNKSPKKETQLGWGAGSENIPVFMFILAIGINRAWFSAQFCHSTLCLLLLRLVKLHWLPWNHLYSEQIETGWCSEGTAVISFQFYRLELLSDLLSQTCTQWSSPWC